MMQGSSQWFSLAQLGTLSIFEDGWSIYYASITDLFHDVYRKDLYRYSICFSVFTSAMIVLRLKLGLFMIDQLKMFHVIQSGKKIWSPRLLETILMMCKQMSLSKGAISGSTWIFQGVVVFDHNHGWHRKPYCIWFPHEEKCRLAGVLAATRQGDAGSTCRSSSLSCRSYDFCFLREAGKLFAVLFSVLGSWITWRGVWW